VGLLVWPVLVLLAAPGRAAAFSLPAWANGDGPIDELEATRTLLRTWPGSDGVPTHTPPHTRRGLAVKNDERCKASCDEGRDFECDRDWDDDKDRYTGSCDTHPTTSCDLACGPGPSPPPKAPWHGAAGTWPHPPPPPPPVDWSPAGWWTLALVLALLLCCFVCVLYYYRRSRVGSRRDWQIAYCCWCILPCLESAVGRRRRYEPCEAEERFVDRRPAPALPLLPGDGKAAAPVVVDGEPVEKESEK